MDKIDLVLPGPEHYPAALALIEAHRSAGEEIIHGCSGLQKGIADYPGWLDHCERFRRGIDLPPGMVPGATYFAIRKRDGALVGTLALRYRLNDFLLHQGGHIGYGVHPLERRKGYATQMLTEALDICKALDIKRTLITCDKENIASARTILACGGLLENEVAVEGGVLFQRYWIDITK